jgi:hypothetical protein
MVRGALAQRKVAAFCGERRLKNERPGVRPSWARAGIRAKKGRWSASGESAVTSPMRARLVDPQGPLWTRIAAPLVASLVLVFGAATGLIAARPLALIGMFLFLLTVLLWRLRPREVEIVPGPGHLDIKRAGPLTQRIRGRRVKGASTAFLTRGIGLVLQHRGRAIALELREDADADAVRDALGIGHHGFGKVGWKVTADRTINATQWVCLGMAALCAYAALVGDLKAILTGVIMAALLGALPLAFFALSSWTGGRLASSQSKRIGVELEPRGVILREPRWEIPYGAIVDVRVTEYGILIMTDPRFNSQLIHVRVNGHMTADELAHCVAQIVAATRRARGLGPREPLVSAEIEDLARGADDARAWLLRLDATAQQMTIGAGYRGSAVDHDELWAALENHEADEHVRAAAARVLARTEKESRKRIQTIAESTRDKITERRIRVVLEPDIDEASRELDELDQRRLMTLGPPEARAVGARGDLR